MTMEALAYGGQTLPVLGDLARLANEAHRRAEGAAVSALEHAREAGEHLTRAKAQCRHGEWLPWLEANFEGTERTARNYITVARRWDELTENRQRVADLSLRAALAELAEPRALPDSPSIFDAVVDEPDTTFEEEAEPPYHTGDTVSNPADWSESATWAETAESAETAEWAAPPTAPKPHVAHNSGNNEWYTPPEYIEAARRVMGAIDLDPASSAVANQTVRATTYYTATDDGLTRPWHGRVFLNPPYSGDLVGRFATRTVDALRAAEIEQAVDRTPLHRDALPTPRRVEPKRHQRDESEGVVLHAQRRNEVDGRHGDGRAAPPSRTIQGADGGGDRRLAPDARRPRPARRRPAEPRVMTPEQYLTVLLKGHKSGLTRGELAQRLALTDRAMRKLIEEAVAESDWPILPPTVTGGVYRLARADEHDLVNQANAEDTSRAVSLHRKARGRQRAFERRYQAGGLFLNYVPETLDEGARGPA